MKLAFKPGHLTISCSVCECVHLYTAVHEQMVKWKIINSSLIDVWSWNIALNVQEYNIQYVWKSVLHESTRKET